MSARARVTDRDPIIVNVGHPRSAPSIPPDDYVVGWRADGMVASRYGDLKWDRTSSSALGTSQVLNFTFWKNTSEVTGQRMDLVNEMHWIIYVLTFQSGEKRYAFRRISRFLQLLRSMASYCDEVGVTIKKLLISEALLSNFVSIVVEDSVGVLVSLCVKLNEIGSEITGYATPKTKFLNSIMLIWKGYKKSLKQHPPLPTRIYAHVLRTLCAELSEFQKIADRYLALTRVCSLHAEHRRSHSVGVSEKLTGSEHYPKEPRMEALLNDAGLTDYFQKVGLDVSLIGLSGGIRRIFMIIRLTIVAFTGMRDGEVSYLKYNCLEERSRFGKVGYIVKGYTTKINGGKPKSASWVTNSDGATAIKLAQKVSALCHEIFARTTGKTGYPLEDVPLLASTVHLGISGAPWRDKFRENDMRASGIKIRGDSAVRRSLQPVIEEEDIRELEQIDWHRAWRSEAKFRIGSPWTLTAHQLRRSLALYAQRSGLVSLPSLRRQLQHLTEEMARYYARGSVFAKNFVGENKEHFASEWQATQALSSALSYFKHVEDSDNVLFGGHGNWIEHRLRGQDGEVLSDRGMTLKRFEKGELAYRETSLGGCINPEPCDKRPIRWINVDCVAGCQHLVGQLPSLERVIGAQTALVASLDPTSFAYQSEKADLDTLTNVRDKVLAQASRKKRK